MKVKLKNIDNFIPPSNYHEDNIFDFETDIEHEYKIGFLDGKMPCKSDRVIVVIENVEDIFDILEKYNFEINTFQIKGMKRNIVKYKNKDSTLYLMQNYNTGMPNFESDNWEKFKERLISYHRDRL